jgi:Leucine-rich repeat (LRR) protein
MCGSTIVNAQNVNIPDANFKARLLAHGYSYTGAGIGIIDANQDSEIQVTEAASYAGKIAATGANISDMTGVEAFTNAPNLYCNNNNITALDLSNNTQLTVLECFNNSLTSLDVSNNANLISLYCVMNSISSLNVSGLTQLTSINCSLNQLTSLDINSVTALYTLVCSDNLLTTLVPSSNLNSITCQNNQLTSLDFSGCFGMVELNCSTNDLSSLNMANWNNQNLSTFNATTNPNLTCIQVNDVAWCTTNHTVVGGQIDSGVSFSTSCSACIVTIPDANFKAYLVGNTAINTNGDTEIQCSEASAFTSFISCNNLSITDLTGIEAFTSLDALYCDNNQLTSLDLSQNTVLTILECENNQLSNINVTQNVQLVEFKCNGNQLTSLDISQNSALVTFRCSNNQLTSLDFTNNPFLIWISCANNQIISLDITQNTAITAINVQDNLLVGLDASQNANVNEIYCYNNQLTSLNVANGNNLNVGLFAATGNPNLTCIKVDDASYSTTNWIDIDAGASFSENCGVGMNEITFAEVSIHPNPASSQITIDTDEQIETIMIFNMYGSFVQQESTATFSIEELSLGVYFANVQTSAGMACVRFVKH